MKEGQWLTTVDSELQISEVSWLDTQLTAYNMTVGQSHTYTVGDEQVWVHNDCDLLGKKLKNNKTANEFAQSKDYADAHKLKEAYVGKDNISKFNIYLDKKTGLAQLVNRDGKIIIDIVD